jgi:hypothetical protein
VVGIPLDTFSQNSVTQLLPLAERLTWDKVTSFSDVLDSTSRGMVDF